MWKKDAPNGGKGKRMTLAGEPLMPLTIKKSKPKPPVSHWVRYTALASGETMDVSEVIPAPETGLGFEQFAGTGAQVLKNTGGGNAGASMNPFMTTMTTSKSTGMGNPSVDIWATTGGAGSPAKLKKLMKEKKVKPAMDNRKVLLMMSSKTKKGGGGKGGKGAGNKKTGKAKTGKPSSMLAQLKAEVAAEVEGGGSMGGIEGVGFDSRTEV